jgi:dipeptidyl aminopeptidase/acylaminoacyl peptidase
MGVVVSSPSSSAQSSQTSATSSAVKRYSVRELFRNPDQAAFQVSRGGKFISTLRPHEKRMNIFIREASTPNAQFRRLTDVRDRDIAGYSWKGDDVILYTKDNGGDENFHIYAVNVNSGEPVDLTPFPGVRATVLDVLDSQPDEILMQMNKRSSSVFDVYRLNVRTGALTLAAENPGDIVGWQTDHDGKVRLATALNGEKQVMLYREDESKPFTELMVMSFRDTFAPYIFTFDNKHIYVASNLKRDKTAIVRFDPATKQEVEVLFEHPQVDAGGLGFSQRRKVLTSISYMTWKQERKFLDAQTEKIYTEIQRRLPNDEIRVASITQSEDIAVVLTVSDRSYGAYYLYNVKAGSLEKLADVAPWIVADDMCPMQPIQFASRDGLTLHGYLTLPKGYDMKTAKNLPVVVNPHGGPWSRDVWGFRPDVQFLANRGFAVLQVNFRGSTGYGRSFLDAGDKQWGKAMQHDLTDGVEWLKKQGIADPKRVAIYGGSYGGYAVLAGLAFTPDVYACGVDVVGPSNLFTLLSTIPPYWKPMLAQMYARMGNPEQDKDLLTAISPVFHADKIKAPLLVIQGARDPRVNVAESEQIVAALKKRNIDVEYMVKENEGHGYRNEENRLEMYERIEAFLAKHLLPNQPSIQVPAKN